MQHLCTLSEGVCRYDAGYWVRQQLVILIHARQLADCERWPNWIDLDATSKKEWSAIRLNSAFYTPLLREGIRKRAAQTIKAHVSARVNGCHHRLLPDNDSDLVEIPKRWVGYQPSLRHRQAGLIRK